MVPVTDPAVSGSTLKYTGAGCAFRGAGLFSIDLSRATGKQRGRTTEMEKVNGFHLWLVTYSFPGGPAFLGISPVRASRNCDQILAVLSGKVERFHVLIEIGIGVAASGIKIDHIMERLQAAIVHVRCAERNIAQASAS